MWAGEREREKISERMKDICDNIQWGASGFCFGFSLKKNNNFFLKAEKAFLVLGELRVVQKEDKETEAEKHNKKS